MHFFFQTSKRVNNCLHNNHSKSIYNLKKWVSFAWPTISLFLAIILLHFPALFILLSKLFWHFTAVFGLLLCMCWSDSFSLLHMTFSLVLSTCFLFELLFLGWQLSFPISLLLLPFWWTFPELVPSAALSSCECRHSAG